MIIEDTNLKGVKLIKPTVHEDYRGTNIETWHKDNYAQLGVNFILDSISTSRRHTLRGIHGDDRTTKLVSWCCRNSGLAKISSLVCLAKQNQIGKALSSLHTITLT